MKRPALLDEIFGWDGIRSISDDDGELWFMCQDLCKVLDICWAGRSNQLKCVPRGWIQKMTVNSAGGLQKAIMINEAAVFMVILRSSKPKSREIAKWLCHDVLPKLRRNRVLLKIA